MPVSVTITADDTPQLHSVFLALAGGLAAPTTAIPPGWGYPEPVADVLPLFPDADTGEAEMSPPPSATENITEAFAKPKRGRGRPKAQAAPDAGEAAPDEDETAPEAMQAAPEASGAAQGELFKAPGAMAPGELAAARDEALTLLRQLYALPGMPDQVNALLPVFGVARFTQLPIERGPELLAMARRMEAEAASA